MILAGRRLELLFRQRFRELFEQLPLILGDLLRRDDLDCDHQVAARPTRHHVRHAAAAEPERRAARGALWNPEGLFTFDGWNGDLAAERERRIVQRNLAIQVVAVAM